MQIQCFATEINVIETGIKLARSKNDVELVYEINFTG
jgi:hypothetical protein